MLKIIRVTREIPLIDRVGQIEECHRAAKELFEWVTSVIDMAAMTTGRPSTFRSSRYFFTGFLLAFHALNKWEHGGAAINPQIAFDNEPADGENALNGIAEKIDAEAKQFARTKREYVYIMDYVGWALMEVAHGMMENHVEDYLRGNPAPRKR